MSDSDVIRNAWRQIAGQSNNRPPSGDNAAITGALNDYIYSSLTNGYNQLYQKQQSQYQAEQAARLQAEQEAMASQPAPTAAPQPTYVPPEYTSAETTTAPALPVKPSFSFDLPIVGQVQLDENTPVYGGIMSAWEAGKQVPVLGGAESAVEQIGPSAALGAGMGLVTGGIPTAIGGAVIGGLAGTEPGKQALEWYQENVAGPFAGYGVQTGVLPETSNVISPLESTRKQIEQVSRGDIGGAIQTGMEQQASQLAAQPANPISPLTFFRPLQKALSDFGRPTPTTPESRQTTQTFMDDLGKGADLRTLAYDFWNMAKWNGLASLAQADPGAQFASTLLADPISFIPGFGIGTKQKAARVAEATKEIPAFTRAAEALPTSRLLDQPSKVVELVKTAGLNLAANVSHADTFDDAVLRVKQLAKPAEAATAADVLTKPYGLNTLYGRRLTLLVQENGVRLAEQAQAQMDVARRLASPEAEMVEKEAANLPKALREVAQAVREGKKDAAALDLAGKDMLAAALRDEMVAQAAKQFPARPLNPLSRLVNNYLRVPEALMFISGNPVVQGINWLNNRATMALEGVAFENYAARVAKLRKLGRYAEARDLENAMHAEELLSGIGGRALSALHRPAGGAETLGVSGGGPFAGINRWVQAHDNMPLLLGWYGKVERADRAATWLSGYDKFVTSNAIPGKLLPPIGEAHAARLQMAGVAPAEVGQVVAEAFRRGDSKREIWQSVVDYLEGRRQVSPLAELVKQFNAENGTNLTVDEFRTLLTAQDEARLTQTRQQIADRLAAGMPKAEAVDTAVREALQEVAQKVEQLGGKPTAAADFTMRPSPAKGMYDIFDPEGHWLATTRGEAEAKARLDYYRRRGYADVQQERAAGRAEQAAQYQAGVKDPADPLPSPGPGMARLYRGSGPGDTGAFFTDSIAGAQYYIRRNPQGQISYIDLPIEEANHYRNLASTATAGNATTGGVNFELPPELAQRARPYRPGEAVPTRANRPYTESAAPIPAKDDYRSWTKEQLSKRLGEAMNELAKTKSAGKQAALGDELTALSAEIERRRTVTPVAKPEEPVPAGTAPAEPAEVAPTAPPAPPEPAPSPAPPTELPAPEPVTYQHPPELVAALTRDGRYTPEQVATWTPEEAARIAATENLPLTRTQPPTIEELRNFAATRLERGVGTVTARGVPYDEHILSTLNAHLPSHTMPEFTAESLTDPQRRLDAWNILANYVPREQRTYPALNRDQFWTQFRRGARNLNDKEFTATQAIVDAEVESIAKLRGETPEQVYARFAAVESGAPSAGALKQKGAGLIDKAKKFFGVTKNPREAAYITPDGEMLDFSGKSKGRPSGNRSYEHDTVVAAFGEPKRSGAAIDFMRNTNSVRIDADYGLVNFTDAPTARQVRTILDHFSGRDVTIELSDARGNSIDSIDLSARNASDKNIADAISSLTERGGLFQTTKGATEFTQDGRALLRFMRAHDVSTAVHEPQHVFLMLLPTEQRAIVERWAGVKEGSLFETHGRLQYKEINKGSREGRAYVDVQEKFARGFERYLAEGIAPNERLAEVFRQFRDWMLSIYRKITGSEIDVPLSDEVRALYGRMLDSEQAISPSDLKAVEREMRGAAATGQEYLQTKYFDAFFKPGTAEGKDVWLYKGASHVRLPNTWYPIGNPKSRPLEDFPPFASAVGPNKAQLYGTSRRDWQRVPGHEVNEWADKVAARYRQNGLGGVLPDNAGVDDLLALVSENRHFNEPETALYQRGKTPKLPKAQPGQMDMFAQGAQENADLPIVSGVAPTAKAETFAPPEVAKQAEMPGFEQPKPQFANAPTQAGIEAARQFATLADEARQANTFDEFMGRPPRYLSVGGSTVEGVADPATWRDLTLKQLYDLRASDPQALVSGKLWTAQRGGVARRRFSVDKLDLPDDPEAFFNEIRVSATTEPLTLFQQVRDAARAGMESADNPRAAAGYAQSEMLASALMHLRQAALAAEARPAVSPELKAETLRWLTTVLQNYDDVRMAGMMHGDWLQNAALLNYDAHIPYVDSAMMLATPFPIFRTRYLGQTIRRVMDRPALAAWYLHLREAQDSVENDPRYPARFRGKAQIPMPLLPDWMGGSVFFDPLAQLFPVDQVLGINQYESQQDVQDADVAQAIRALAMRGEITPLEAANAIANGGKSPLWTSTQARLQQLAQPTNAWSDLFRPHPPVEIAWKILTGHADDIGVLFPQTRLIKGVTSALGVGGPGGVNIEAGLKGGLRSLTGNTGIPDYDAFEQYRIDRALTDLVGDPQAQVSPRDALIALIERKGPLYEQAKARAGQAAAVGLLPSGSVFPAGEREYYKARIARDQLLDREVQRLGADPARMTQDAKWQYVRANGATGANSQIQKFYNDNPVLGTKAELFNEPETRIKGFLTTELWDKYMGLSALDRRNLGAQLGADFKTYFQNRDSRDYSKVSLEELADWTRRVRGYVPQSPDVKLPEGATPPIQYADPKTAADYDRMLAERDSLFNMEALRPLQDAYYQIPASDTAGRKQYRDTHPLLAAYNRWYAGQMQKYPALAKVLQPDYQQTAYTNTRAAARTQAEVAAYGGRLVVSQVGPFARRLATAQHRGGRGRAEGSTFSFALIDTQTMSELVNYWKFRRRLSKTANGKLFSLYRKYRMGAGSFNEWLYLLRQLYGR